MHASWLIGNVPYYLLGQLSGVTRTITRLDPGAPSKEPRDWHDLHKVAKALRSCTSHLWNMIADYLVPVGAIEEELPSLWIDDGYSVVCSSQHNFDNRHHEDICSFLSFLSHCLELSSQLTFESSYYLAILGRNWNFIYLPCPLLIDLLNVPLFQILGSNNFILFNIYTSCSYISSLAFSVSVLC